MAVANPSADKTRATVITDAKSGASSDLSTRQKRYAITMAFRTACFVAMIIVPGGFRWVLLGGAVFLPYIAVLLANEHNSKQTPEGQIEKGGPEPAPQLLSKPENNDDPEDSQDIDGMIEDEAR